ncbi:MAG: hypothetical protein H6740_27215 [Alphaproteobacteria bacterium]|nr:hypothetical protein [Alphaproteobacteria bacterium]
MQPSDPDWLDLLRDLEHDPAGRLPRAQRLWEDIARALGDTGEDPDRLVVLLNRAFDAGHNDQARTFVWHWRVFAWNEGGQVAIHYGHHATPLGVRADHLLVHRGGAWVFDEQNPDSYELDFADVPSAIAFEIVCAWDGVPGIG